MSRRRRRPVLTPQACVQPDGKVPAAYLAIARLMLGKTCDVRAAIRGHMERMAKR